MTLFSRKKADRSLAEETALVPADDENSRQQDADKHMISGKKKCQEVAQGRVSQKVQGQQ